MIRKKYDFLFVLPLIDKGNNSISMSNNNLFIKRKKKVGSQTKTEKNANSKRKTTKQQKQRTATKTNADVLRNGLFDHDRQIPDLFII